MSTTLISAEEYLHTDYSPDCDYVDGVVLERNGGEREHSILQAFLIAWFYSRRRELGIHVYPEQRVQVAARRYRVPDVCVVAGARPTERILTRPPLISIEILSPEDRMSRMQEKIADYLRMGVPQVGVIDPESRRAWIHTEAGAREARDGFLRTAQPEIEVPLAELFSALESD